MPINTPTLALADNADGSGVTATVAGSTAGSTNALYAAPWSGGFVPAAFATAWNRIGDGNIVANLAAGYHWCHVLSTLAAESAISLVRGIRATSGAAAEFDQKLDGVVAKIQTLSLSGYTSADVLKRKFPWNRNSPGAGIFVTPLSDEFRYVLNQADDFNDAIQVTTVKASNEDLVNGIPAHLMVRQQLVNSLLPNHGNPALAGVSVVHDVTVRPGPIFDARTFEAHFDVSVIVVIPASRRTRGLV